MNNIEVCIYCDQQVNLNLELEQTFCCIWSYYQFHTQSEIFSTNDFKDLVKHSYKIPKSKKSKKRTSIKYDNSSFHLHTE